MRIDQNDNNTSPSKSEYSGPMYRIHWKWLLGTVAVLGIIGAVLGGLYFLQTKDQAEFRIGVYKAAEEAGNWRDGLQQLILYHDEKPTDMEIVRVLAEAFDENGVYAGDWNNAVRYYQMLLAQKTTNEERLPILLRILDNQRKAMSIPDMPSSIQRILEIDPENPLAWKCLVILRAPMLNTGIYSPGAKEPATFDLLIQKALELNPDDPELFNTYARLLRSNSPNILACVSQEYKNKTLAEREKEADQFMADFAASHPDDPIVLLTHYEYRLKNNLLSLESKDPDKELMKVLELEPNNLIAMMYLSMFFEQSAMQMQHEEDGETPEERHQKAIDGYQKTIAANPSFPMAYIQLATLYNINGDQEKRIQTLEQANKALRATDLNVIVSLAVAYLENKNTAEANKTIQQIHSWIERNRGGEAKADTVRSCLQMAAMLEGQSLVISGHMMEAITKFRSVFEPTIPRKIDIRLVFNTLMMYGQALESSIYLDAAADVYGQVTRYLESEMQTHDMLNFLRMEEAFLREVNAWEQLGQMDKYQMAMDRYLDYLRKEIKVQPDNQMIRLSLALALYQTVMRQTASNRDWTELDGVMETLYANKLRVFPSWRVDLLRANVQWEKLNRAYSQIEEVLIPLRVAENEYNDDLLFLVALEETYHNFRSPKDSDRVLEQIRTFSDGEVYWHLIRAMRAEQQGNLLESKRLLEEAVKNLPESQKDIFLAAQEELLRKTEGAQSSFVRDKQMLEQLRSGNKESPTINTLFRQGLMELDFGYVDDVAKTEKELHKLEGKDGTLFVFLEGERLLQEAVSPKDAKIDQARARQRILVGKRPNWSYTYILLADIEEYVGNKTALINAQAKAIDVGDRDMQRHRDLIELYRSNNQPAEAERAYNRSVRLFPNLMTGIYMRFDQPYQRYNQQFVRAIRREDIAEAKKIAEQWLNDAATAGIAEEQIALYRTIIAQSFFNVNQMDIAGEYFKKAAEGGKESVLPLAKYQAETGNVKEALQLIYDAMITSENPSVFFMSALGLIRDYEYEPEWIKPFDDFVLDFDVSQSQKVDELFQYVQYLAIRKMNENTLPFYRRMNELSSNNAFVMNDLAYLVAFQETENQAEKDANSREGLILVDKAINLQDDNPMFIDTKGLILMHQGKTEDAVAWFEKAVDLSNNGMIYRLHLAVALLRNGDDGRARDIFDSLKPYLVPQMDLLPESNRDYTKELLDAFPEK